LRPVRRRCPACGASMRIRYDNQQTVVTLTGAVRCLSKELSGKLMLRLLFWGGVALGVEPDRADGRPVARLS
jgi:hypothetical protein